MFHYLSNKKLESRLSELKSKLELYEMLLKHMPHIFYLIDPNDCSIIFSNDSEVDISTRPKCYEIRLGSGCICKKEEGNCILKEVIHRNSIVNVENIYMHKECCNKTENVTGIPLKNDNNNLIGVLAMINEPAKDKNFRDVLTGLYNRDYLYEELQRLQAQRFSKYGVIYGDIDYLKLANDVFGYSLGDTLIKTVADLFKQCCRKEDFVARRGNKADEFIIIEREASDDLLHNTKERILQALEIASQKIDYPLSVSLGLAIKKEKDKSFEDVLERANNALSKSKSDNRMPYGKKLLTFYERKINEKFPSNRRHVSNMINLATGFALSLGYSREQLSILHKTIIYKDIGGVNMPHPDSCKKSISKSDMELIFSHPFIGAEIASRIPDIIDCTKNILTHHCNWDGSGYPPCYKGEDIPEMSRLIKICSDYERKVTKIDFLEPNGIENVFHSLKHRRGKIYDPKMFDEFVKYVRETYTYSEG